VTDSGWDVESVKESLVAAYAADVDRVLAAGREAFGGDVTAGRVLEPLARGAGSAASAGLLQAVIGLAAQAQTAGGCLSGLRRAGADRGGPSEDGQHLGWAHFLPAEVFPLPGVPGRVRAVRRFDRRGGPDVGVYG
jgi:hypothetical protein